MRALIQRVSQGSITIDGEPGETMGRGLVIFLGISQGNSSDDVQWLAEKILKLKVFDDADVTSTGKNSVTDIQGGILIVSQFTLHASTRKGTKPSYHRSAAPNVAEPLYDLFVKTIRRSHSGLVITGRFGAFMEVQLTNDGPVTILIDSKNKE